MIELPSAIDWSLNEEDAGVVPKLNCGVVFNGVPYPLGVPFKGVPNFFCGVFPYKPLIGGPPGLSEGVLRVDAGVVGVRNPLTGLFTA